MIIIIPPIYGALFVVRPCVSEYALIVTVIQELGDFILKHISKLRLRD